MSARRACAAALAVLGVVGGAGGPDPAAAAPALAGEVQWVDPIEAVAADARAVGDISKILYLNRCAGGCAIEKSGTNDSRADTSTIPVQNGVSTISAYAGTDLAFDAVVACVREVYGPYDVEVVTEDPGDVFHHEAVFGGRPTEVGREPNVGGIAPASCEPLNNVMSFTFANLMAEDVEALCWTVAQESAHSFGLPNHSFDCSDPMTYLGPPQFVCGRKFFRDQTFPCGEFVEAPCNCGLDGQNSHARLLEVFGPGVTPAPSEVEIALPTEGEEVGDGFDVFFFASSPRQVARVELVVNDTVYAEAPGHPYARRNADYRFAMPTVADGYLDLEVAAYDDLGTRGVAQVTVLKGAPCDGDDACLALQTCDDGRCSYPPSTGRLGDDCPFDQFCVEGTCLERDGERRCVTTCDPRGDDPCADGFECAATATGGGCFPVDGGGGCCAVAGADDRGLPLAALGLSVVAFVALRRRRCGYRSRASTL